MNRTMRGVRAVGWLAVWSLFVSAAAGCAGGDEEATPQYAEPCEGVCAEGLECVNRLCTIRCGSANDCVPISPTAICDSNYCYEPCMSTFNCPNGLACTQQQTSMRMTCRPR